VIRTSFKDKFLQGGILDALAKIEKLEREEAKQKESLETLKLTILL
jgi:hypothetical protein